VAQPSGSTAVAPRQRGGNVHPPWRLDSATRTTHARPIAHGPFGGRRVTWRLRGVSVGPTDVTKQKDVPASPLCTISPLFSELTQHDCRGGPADTIRDSEAFQAWELLSRCANNSDFAMVSAGTGERVSADESSRRRIWSGENERTVQQCELEKRRVMEVFEKGQPNGDRKERRKVQNRQAQRTFRAKLKMTRRWVRFLGFPRIHIIVVSCRPGRVLTLAPGRFRLSHLERLNEVQTESPRRADSARRPS
jgi:hypothetical protein